MFHDVTNVVHAKRALQAGVDGLILVCAGAGGHAGRLSPFALVPEVRQFYDGCILLSGSIANGASVLAAQALGADLAYLGTRFIAAREANATEDNKQCIIDSSGEEIVYTNLFTGVHGNYLKKSIAASGLDPDDLPVADKSKMNFDSGGNSKAKAWRDIWGAGQGVGQIFDAPPAAEIVARLKAEYDAARAALFAGETVPTQLKAGGGVAPHVPLRDPRRRRPRRRRRLRLITSTAPTRGRGRRRRSARVPASPMFARTRSNDSTAGKDG